MSYYGYGWRPYVSAGQKRQQAAKKIAAMRKKGGMVEPVALQGKKIANTFWGKSWCDNLESYSDYSNRLPRGRTYVRNGYVLDLKINAGKITALVQGSSVYDVNVAITPVQTEQWNGLIQECSGKIDSLIELLQGQFSKNIMEVMTRPKTGLFPNPKQIKLNCSCPDWAEMCKHVAAVLYGVGARLDEKPELLFKLRQVDHQELINTASVAKTTRAKPVTDADEILDAANLENIFGIEMAGAPTQATQEKPSQKRVLVRKVTARKKPARRKSTAVKVALKSRPARIQSPGQQAT